MWRNITVWIFQETNWRDCTQEDLDEIEKGNPKKETKSLLIPAINNAIKTNYIKLKLTIRNRIASEGRLCGERERYATINRLISECSKLAQKSIELGMTGWERWSTGICASDQNFTILLNCICTNQNRSKWITFSKFSEILWYKLIISHRAEDGT